MKIKIIHQWRDWLLERVGVGQYSFIKKDNKIDIRTIVAKNDMNAKHQRPEWSGVASIRNQNV